jgi:hypothetical protein
MKTVKTIESNWARTPRPYNRLRISCRGRVCQAAERDSGIFEGKCSEGES